MSTTSALDTIDLRAIFRKLLAKWWLFLITGIIAGALGVAYIKTTAKIFRVEAVLLMSERGRNQLGPATEFIKGTAFLGGNSEIEDQIAVLTSVTNVKRTLKRLDFGITYYERYRFLTQQKYDYPPFFVTLDTVAVQVYGIPVHVEVDREAGTYRVKAKAKFASLYNVQKQTELDDFITGYEVDQVARIGEPFVAEGLSFTIEFPEDRTYSADKEYFFTINSLDALVAEHRAKTVAVPLSDESSIVSVSTTGEVTSKEKLYINKLLESYIEGELYRRHQKGLKTINFIDDQIGIVSDSLREVESSMEGFRGRSGGMISAATTSDALFQERSRLERERSDLVARMQYCRSILDKVRSQSDLRNVPAPSSSGIDDPVLNNLVMEITRMSADLAAQNVSAGPRNNPAIVAMERRLKNLTASLAQTAESLVQQVEIGLAQVNKSLGRINHEFNQLPENERRLGNIQRKFNLSESLYNYLMEKRAEAGIAIASDEVDKWVVDEARTTGKAIKPSKRMALGGALALSILLPIILIIVQDLIKDSIADLDHLKRITPIPVLATIPSSKRKRIDLDD
ncbi:MAG: Wzz/FepE/Etk N-terminal domain-containing protein, partial [Flavobacteriales bacterium]|nr:Wzz/FepE/Etk N-terminal domain-containing protein [Flavobacteriales bacterium]